MTALRVRWCAALGLVLMGTVAGVRAGETAWKPVARTSVPAAMVASPFPTGSTASASAIVTTPRPSGPAATLGRPEPLDEPAPSAPASSTSYLEDRSSWSPVPASGARAVAPVSFEDSPRGPLPYTARGQLPPDPPPVGGPVMVPAPGPTGAVPPPGAVGGVPPPPPPVADPFPVNGGVAVDQPLNRPFMDRMRDWFKPDRSSHCGGWFQSDHAFDNFNVRGDLISPVSNPFFFEDPRALTEVRPIFLYQTAPSNSPLRGGDSFFFGTQARVAFTDRWSLVVNKLGFVTLDSHNHDDPEPSGSHTGFGELWLGPKWTFLRNEQAGRVAAVGLTLEIPTGSARTFQDTGDLGLDPYVTFGQTFGRTSFGTFNFLAAGGYSFATDNKRTEFLHGSLHLDYDVGNLHRIYPLAEVNWFHTTKFGRAVDVGGEGADLVNFGSSSVAGGRDLVTMALGARYKFGGSDNFQLGTAFEFPVTNRKDLADFRFTFDLIFRY